MRIVGTRLTPEGETFAALLDARSGSVRILGDLATFWAGPDSAIASGDLVGELPLSDIFLVPPVLPGARVLCVGVNYRAHAAEGSYKDQPLAPFPTIFGRWASSLTVGGVPVPVPANEQGMHWEGEVAAFVGAPLVDVDPDRARDAVFGYAAFNDLTARRAQKLTSQWTLGKNADASGPLSAIVTRDEVGDLRDGLRVTTRVNGELVQDGNTRDMIHELGDILSLVSRTMSLRPGDVVCTGTPDGVGYARTPPWLLHPGDHVEVEVERVGSVANPIVANDARHGAADAVAQAR